MKRMVLLLVLVFPAPAIRAAEPTKPFPEAKHGKGELRYVDGVPVLLLKGKPAEMGEQFGELAVQNAPDLMGLHERFLKDSGQEKRYSLLAGMAGLLKANFPPHILTEVEAAAKQSKRDIGLLLFANTVADLSSGMGCSTVVVEKARSMTGGPLFGRNFDWLATKGITEHTLVVVYKGEGKRAFAAVTVSPICGVISGMNDAGLSVTMNEINIKESKDKAPFNWKGTPIMLAFRRVLEDCGTVAEAEKLLREMHDHDRLHDDLRQERRGGVRDHAEDAGSAFARERRLLLHESLPQRGAVRERQVLALCEARAAVREGRGKLGVADVFSHLDDVQQGKNTLQSMVFEPADRVLHLSYGDGLATKLKPHNLDLGELFDEK